MEQEKEIWKPIAGYENLYYISNLGRVKSLLGYGGVKERILKPAMGRDYLHVSLNDNGRKKTLKIHRLVAQTFIPNPENLPQVNHLNENKTDNRACNLEWCSAKYNSNYGTAIQRTIEKISKPVICIELNTTFQNSLEAKKHLGVDNSSIIKCCRGKLKTCGGYHWKYA